jgi:maltose O-acetyltransferase
VSPFKVRLLVYLAGHPLMPHRLKTSLLRLAGVVTDGPVGLGQWVVLYGGGRLRIGRNSGLSHRVTVDHSADVSIGDNVAVGPGSSLMTSGHDMRDSSVRCGKHVLRPITIESGAWLAANVLVTGGVTIGAGAVIGAGSVVTRDVPPNTLWAGAPAREVRSLPI